jgi:hypothetical protein
VLIDVVSTSGAFSSAWCILMLSEAAMVRCLSSARDFEGRYSVSQNYSPGSYHELWCLCSK